MNLLFCPAYAFRKIEMCKKPGRMYTGIRSSATRGLHRRTETGAERTVEQFLYRNCIGLYLPAMEGRSIIGKLNKITRGAQSDAKILFYLYLACGLLF